MTGFVITKQQVRMCNSQRMETQDTDLTVRKVLQQADQLWTNKTFKTSHTRMHTLKQETQDSFHL